MKNRLRIVLAAAVTLVFAGIVHFGTRSADAPPAATGAPATALDRPAAPIVVNRAPGDDGAGARLHRPVMRTDRASVIGASDPIDTAGLSKAEIAALGIRPPAPPPSPQAIAAGEAEKEARRAETRAIQEARARGEHVSGKEDGRASPGTIVDEAEDDE